MPVIKRITKCTHCDYVDFLDKTELPSRCPSCSSTLKQIRNPFEVEKIKVTHKTTRNRKVTVDITFHQCNDRVRVIVGKTLNKTIPDKSLQERVLYMLQIYTWILLKKAPQLWHDLNMIIEGMREILTLRLNKEKEVWLEKQKPIWYDTLTRDQAEKRLRQLSIIEARMKREGRKP